jgi:DnaJ homologue, subfamily C, member 28, conserved domain
MTERKPRGMSYPSWIDRQIQEAEKRGVFDNLPGTGKPIPRREGADYGQAWLRDYLRREGVSTEEMLPTPLKLRKAAERLAEAVPGMRSEDEVRQTVRELNRQIVDWRRDSLGPPIFVPRVDEEAMVGRWRAGHSAQPPATGASATEASAPEAGPHREEAPRPHWWRRLRRRARAS